MSNFVLEKDIVNRVVLTLAERSQLIDPYYLIVFTGKFSTELDVKVVSVTDATTPNQRYNLVEIIETTNPDPLLGEVFLIEGQWNYEVYESSNQVLDINDTTGRILQRGQIVVRNGMV